MNFTVKLLGSVLLLTCILSTTTITTPASAQLKRVRVAVPGYTIAVLSFLAAKMNGYYAAEAEKKMTAMVLKIRGRERSPACRETLRFFACEKSPRRVTSERLAGPGPKR